MNRFIRTFIGCGISLVVLSASALHAELTIIDNCIPRAVIVIRKDFSLTERHAARELQHYLHQVTGTALPIVTDDVNLEGKWVFGHGQVRVREDAAGPTATSRGIRILLGQNRYVRELGITVDAETKLPDPVLIEARDRTLLIVGKGDRGTLFGVYQFLEEYVGCRWVMPGPLGEIIPHTMSVTIPEVSKVYNPSFERRSFMSGWFTSSYDRDWYVEWSIKNRMQVIDSHVDYLPDRGGADIVDQAHAWGYLIPHARYQYDHPEYIALFNGEREVNLPYNAQFCSTNPEVVSRVKGEVVKYFKQQPDADVMSLAPADGGRFCQCPFCQTIDAGTPYTYGSRTVPSRENQIIRFSNAVAGSFPDRMFLTFAYNIYINPPETINPLPNVLILLWRYAPANYAAPINAPDDPLNVKYNSYLTGWIERGANVMYGAYTSKSAWQMMPWPVARRLAKDLKYVHSLGVRNYSCMPHATGRWASIGQVMYMQAKLLWDVTLDPEAVLQDYISSSYGPAAPAMWQYIDTLEKAAQAPGVLFNDNPMKQARNFLTPEVMARTGRYLSEAEELAETDRVRERVELIRITHEYTNRWLDIHDILMMFDRMQDVTLLEQAENLFWELEAYVKRHAYKDAVNYFAGELDVLGIQVETWDWYGGLWKEIQRRRDVIRTH